LEAIGVPERCERRPLALLRTIRSAGPLPGQAHLNSLLVRQLSLAPGFSRVVLAALAGNGFNRFPAGRNAKPLKRLDAAAPPTPG
jgi:hypothetical protein